MPRAPCEASRSSDLFVAVCATIAEQIRRSRDALSQRRATLLVGIDGARTHCIGSHSRSKSLRSSRAAIQLKLISEFAPRPRISSRCSATTSLAATDSRRYRTRPPQTAPGRDVRIFRQHSEQYAWSKLDATGRAWSIAEKPLSHAWIARPRAGSATTGRGIEHARSRPWERTHRTGLANPRGTTERLASILSR